MRTYAAERFWSNVLIGSPDECWPWQGFLNPKGYGRFTEGRRGRIQAHRHALALSGVSVPSDMMVLHSCDNPPCCNPAHLRVGTMADNARDTVARNRHPRHMRRATHCRRGHEVSGANALMRTDGRPRCLTCHNASARRRWHRDAIAATA